MSNEGRMLECREREGKNKMINIFVLLIMIVIFFVGAFALIYLVIDFIDMIWYIIKCIHNLFKGKKR